MNSVQFDRVEANERDLVDPFGDTRHRFATEWTVGEDRFRVSSVDSNYTTETYIFPISKQDDEVIWFEVWGDKRWRETEEDHREFLSEFLENRTQEG